MTDSGKKEHLSKFFHLRMAIVEVGEGETNEEAWVRHLTTHPQDFYANIRIFNHKIGQKHKDFKIKPPEKAGKGGKIKKIRR